MEPTEPPGRRNLQWRDRSRERRTGHRRKWEPKTYTYGKRSVGRVAGDRPRRRKLINGSAAEVAMVEAVTIHDVQPRETGVGWVDVHSILRACEPEARTSLWQVFNVDCDGPLASEFMSLGNAKAILGWPELLRLLTGVTDVLSGYFEARQADSERPWLLVKPIRGRECVVVTTSAGLLRRLRARFRDVRPSPDDIGWLAEPGAAPDPAGM